MEFRLLGQLEVLRGGEPVDLGPRRQRSLLALLLLHRGQVLPSDRILEALWGDDGATKQQVLWVHVSNLRSALEPDRPKRSDGSFVRTRAPGYVFETDGHHVDVDRFEELVAAGSARLADEPEVAASQLAEALTLWRGTPCEEFVYEPFVHDEVSRLEEIRLEALEHRIEADLALGRASEVVAELETLVREHPIRESFTALLMRALFATGRQAEALRRYQHYRIQLVEDVGLEPSPHLRRLEERILVGDQSLHGRSGGGGGHVRSYEIGERLGEGSFSIVHRGRQPSVGREVAIKVIRAELANDPDFVRRFEAEAQMVAKLEHPHIVPLYDYWRDPDGAYLVMQMRQLASKPQP